MNLFIYPPPLFKESLNVSDTHISSYSKDMLYSFLPLVKLSGREGNYPNMNYNF